MTDIKIGKFTLGIYQTNCYFLYKEGCKDTIVVDPADQGEKIYEKLSADGFNVKAIILTHGHFDHIWGVKGLKDRSRAKVYALDKEAELLKDPELNVSEMMGRPVMVVPDDFFRDGDTVTLADMTFKVIATPGHTAGSACYYFEDSKLLISGDTLFCESVGRTDFPTGSEKAITDSLNNKLMLLPDDVKVFPGHGGSTTIGSERENNPFVY